MRASRVEAFTDAVIAILITIMVLELPKPDGADFAALSRDLPALLAYVLSFIYLGISWNNHHHIFVASQRVTGGVLLANLHVLFWLSLIPFTTAWMSEQKFAQVPVIAFGAILLASGTAFTILQGMLIRADGPESRLAAALGRNIKGKITLAGFALGIGLTFVDPRIGLAVYAVVVLSWLIPDRRIERTLQDAEASEQASTTSKK